MAERKDLGHTVQMMRPQEAQTILTKMLLRILEMSAFPFSSSSVMDSVSSYLLKRCLREDSLGKIYRNVGGMQFKIYYQKLFVAWVKSMDSPEHAQANDYSPTRDLREPRRGLVVANCCHLFISYAYLAFRRSSLLHVVYSFLLRTPSRRGTRQERLPCTLNPAQLQSPKLRN